MCALGMPGACERISMTKYVLQPPASGGPSMNSKSIWKGARKIDAKGSMTLQSTLPAETPLEKVKRLFREAQDLDLMARLKLEEAEAARRQLPVPLTPMEEYIDEQEQWAKGK